ncbi:MAG: sulfurtransferase [Burkholderiales bacterium]|nr:sulfurtransferase [Burkholderiales bacterium]
MDVSIAAERSAEIRKVIGRLKRIVREHGVTRDSLDRMKTEMVGLASRSDLFPIADFPIVPGGNSANYRLAEDDDHSFALYASVGTPGKVRPPHNHTTWAIISGVVGDEHNVCYERTDDDSKPGRGALRRTGELTVKPGNAIAFMPEDFHTIEVMNGEKSLHLHMYGMSLRHLPRRVCFEGPEGGGYRFFPPTKSVGIVDAAALKSMLHDGGEIALLDVREEGVYAKCHMLLACSAPLSTLEVRAPLLVPRKSTRIVLVDGNDGLSQRAADVLLRHGYDDVSVLAGGIDAWAETGYEIYSGVNVPSKAFGEFVEHKYHTPRMEAAEVKARLDRGEDILILDSRPLHEYRKVSIPGGIDCPGAELAYRVHDLVKSPDTLVVVNCAGRTRSIIGAQSLINAGIPNRVVALKNGTMGWHLAGFQVASGQDLIAPRPSPEGRTKALAVAERVARRFGVQYIDAARVAELASERDTRTLYLLDVRSPEEFEEGHLEGAISAPGGQLVQTTDAYVGVRNSRIVLVDDYGVRATMTASWLIQMGWKEVYVARGMLGSAPLKRGKQSAPVLGLDDVRCEAISALELQKLVAAEKATVIDLDSKPRYAEGHVPGAWHAIRANLETSLKKVPVDSGLVVLVSGDGVIARLAAPECARLSGNPVKTLDGGMNAWVRGGLPVEKGMTRMTDSVDDVWVRAHDRTENREQAMKDYLTWEVDLITQIGRDDDVEFRYFDHR